MSGGNRGIVAAFAGLAALAATFSLGCYVTALYYPKEQRYQAYRYASDKPQEIDPALKLKANSETLEYREPCRNPKGRDESELCAEWRSAKAGEDSAWWAQCGFWVTFAGIAGLLITIIQSRIALDRAREANNIAREANDQQLRPYVFFYDKDGAEEMKLSKDGWILVTLKNFGQTPVKSARYRTGMFLTTLPIGEGDPEFHAPPIEMGTWGPGDTKGIHNFFDKMPDTFFQKALSGDYALVVRVRVDYEWGESGHDFHEVLMASFPWQLATGKLFQLTEADRHREKR